MKQSRRAQRMQRQNTRARRLPGLNLVALMDIFTILVFFLLVNTSGVQDIPTSHSVELPESIAEAPPRQTRVVTITERDILLDGNPVGAIADARESPEPTIATLRAAIERGLPPAGDRADRGEVTILGDKAIPFRLLRKVMATLTEAGFGRMSLAVVQKDEQEG